MSKKKSSRELTPEDIKKWGEKLGERLHLTYVDMLCLQHYANFWKKNPSYSGEYVAIFNYFYRIFFDRLFLNIFKLLDERKDVLSLPIFFKGCGEIARWEKLKKNDVFRKIKQKRHNRIAHENSILALNYDEDRKHYEKNKQYLSEIKPFLILVQSEFESVLSMNDYNISHYALGDSGESKEFKKLLYKVFPEA